MNPAVAFVAGYIACLITLLPLALFWLLIKPWLRAFLSGSGTSMVALLGARLRGSPVDMLLDAQIALVQRGQPVRFHEVERAYRAHRHRIVGLGDLIGFVEEQMKSDRQALPA